jgi:hypothetical protein
MIGAERCEGVECGSNSAHKRRARDDDARSPSGEERTADCSVVTVWLNVTVDGGKLGTTA